MRKAFRKTKIPSRLQGILWSADIRHLDMERDKSYIVHQILSLGLLEELKWLFHSFSVRELQKIFIEKPIKDYSWSSFNFCKNILLGLENKSLNPGRYVKTLPRNIGSS